MPSSVGRLLLRSLAVAIALAAVFDPAVRSERVTRPYVSLIIEDSLSQRELAARVERELGAAFRVVRAPFPAAAASVIVGSAIPRTAFAHPVFVVEPATLIRMRKVAAPAVTQANSRSTVTATIELPRITPDSRLPTPDSFTLDLLRGEVTVDRARIEWPAGGGSIRTTLDFIPSGEGTESLRLVARAAGSSTSVDFALDVVDSRWSVLFIDQRPSWLSTHVRRALESDPRFSVTSRVTTSRNISTDAGDPPASFGDLTAIEQNHVIVAGAPEMLSASDVAGLDAYLRKRGGAVVFLLDTRPSGAIMSMIGGRTNDWSSAAGTLVQFTGRASDSSPRLISASEYAWPAELPPGASAIVNHPVTGGASAIIWQVAVGSGRILVNGALDSWRFRDSTQGSFDSFWRSTIAAAAEHATSAIEMSIDPSVAEPNARVNLSAVLRDISLRSNTDAPVGIEISGAIVGSADSMALTILPGEQPGTVTSTLNAPRLEGIYRVKVNVGGQFASVPVVVKRGGVNVKRSDTEILAWWASTQGGKRFDERDLRSLVPALLQPIRPDHTSEVWHPMRSPWWILPFALLLGVEWLLRRRAGLV